MLQPPLSSVEVRILGALAEKALTTPDNYPLSLSALTAACNQTTSREPVMQLDEETVTQHVVSLRRRNLLRAIQPAGSRVTKYQHLLAEALDLDARDIGVLGVLMLRGAQTVGELHTRTARLAEFADSAAVEGTLDGLIARQPQALVTRLPRRPGQKEVRFAHLLGGDVAALEEAAAPRAPAPNAEHEQDRVSALGRTVEELRAEVAALRAQFVAFREQFQ